MPENVCIGTADREWLGDWQYVGGQPIRAVSSISPGADATGTADARYVWRREFRVKYECSCGGKTAEVWISGNYSYYHKDVLGRAYPILNANIPLPISGPLGQLASAMGASINLAQWWVNADMVNAGKPAAPSDDATGDDAFTAPPHAVCGTKIRLGDGGDMPWPPDGETADDSNPYITIKCPGSEEQKSGSMGYGVWNPAERSLEMAKELAKAVARVRSGRLAQYYRCEKPCDEQPAARLTLEQEQVMLEPTKAGDDFISAVYQPWTLTLTCAVRTSSLTPEGKSYAMGEFYIGGEGATEAAARLDLCAKSEQKAWEEATEAVMNANLNTETMKTPHFRVSLDEPQFEELEVPEDASGHYALAKITWRLELEVEEKPGEDNSNPVRK